LNNKSTLQIQKGNNSVNTPKLVGSLVCIKTTPKRNYLNPTLVRHPDEEVYTIGESKKTGNDKEHHAHTCNYTVHIAAHLSQPEEL
jgi:hypothetical protein